METFFDNFGTILGSFRGHPGSFRGHSGIIPGSFRGHSGIISATFGHHSGVISALFRRCATRKEARSKPRSAKAQYLRILRRPLAYAPTEPHSASTVWRNIEKYQNVYDHSHYIVQHVRCDGIKPSHARMHQDSAHDTHMREEVRALNPHHRVPAYGGRCSLTFLSPSPSHLHRLLPSSGRFHQ